MTAMPCWRPARWRSLAPPCCWRSAGRHRGRARRARRASAVAALASKVARLWCAGGLVYAAAMLIAPVLLRRDATFGLRRDPVPVRDRLADRHRGLFRRPRGRRAEADAARQSQQDLVGRDRRHASAAWSGGVVVASQFGVGRPRRGRCRRACAVGRVAGRRSRSNPQSSASSAPRMRASSFRATAALMDRLDGFVAAAAAAAPDRRGARRIRCPRARPHGMVSDAGR